MANLQDIQSPDLPRCHLEFLRTHGTETSQHLRRWVARCMMPGWVWARVGGVDLEEEDGEVTGLRRQDHIVEDSACAAGAIMDHLQDAEGLDRHRAVSTGPCALALTDAEVSDHRLATWDHRGSTME